MSTIHPGGKRYALAVLLMSGALAVGCSIMVTPANVPLIKDFENVSLAGNAVIVTNAEKESSEYKILDEKGQDRGFVTDRQAWSKKLVETLARELARRGAAVRSTAPLTLSIALPKIILMQEGEQFRFKVDVVASSSKGWSKNYEASAVSSAGPFESTDAMSYRLAGQAIVEAVKMMLGDAEFISQVGGTLVSQPTPTVSSSPTGTSDIKQKP